MDNISWSPLVRCMYEPKKRIVASIENEQKSGYYDTTNTSNFCNFYSRTPVTRTLKGNEKQFELVGNSSYRGKFQ